MEPAGPTHRELADQMAIPRRRVNDEIIRNRRAITRIPPSGWRGCSMSPPEYWRNLQMHSNLWEQLHDPKVRKEYEKIGPARV